MDDCLERLRSKIHCRNPLITNLLSEFFATTLLLLIVTGIVQQHVLSNERLNAFVQVNLGVGFALCFCVYLCAKTSGGHLNPCISFVFFTMGRLPFSHFLLYSLVQTVGAFVGAALSYAVYIDQYWQYTGDARTIEGAKATAKCFCSFPAEHVSNLTCFFDQFVGSALLALFIVVIIDRRNKIPAHLHPLLIGFVLMMIGKSYGMNLGYPINPARDFGPRIFAFFLYGSGVFSYHNYYFWIPIIAPLPGAAFGAWSYQFFVGAHIPDENKAKKHLLDEEAEPLKKSDS